MLASNAAQIGSTLPAQELMRLLEQVSAAGDYTDLSEDLRECGVSALRFSCQPDATFRIDLIGLGGSGRSAIKIQGRGRVTTSDKTPAATVIQFEVGDAGSAWGLGLVAVLFVCFLAYQLAAGSLETGQVIGSAFGFALLAGASWVGALWQTGRVWPGLESVARRLADGQLLPGRPDAAARGPSN